VFDMNQPGSITRALRGETVGTLVTAGTTESGEDNA